VTKIVSTLSLKIPPRDLKSKDTRQLLSLLCNQWLSLSTCIIQAAIDVIPPPTVAQSSRIPKMLYPDLHEPPTTPKNKLEEDLYSAKAEAGSCVTAYVSKMFAVPRKDLPDKKKKSLTADEMRAKAKEARAARAKEATSPEAQVNNVVDAAVASQPSDEAPASEEPEQTTEENTEIILGFARLYSGVIRTGSTVVALLPKYNMALEPTHPANQKYVVPATVENLYIMMGQDLTAVDFVLPGNIFAIKGLEGKVYRTATLCAPGEMGMEGNIAELHNPGSWLVNLGSVNRSVSEVPSMTVVMSF
jgi:ribosome assembly protein 1